MENAVISDHPFVGQYCTAHTYAFHVREICCCPQLPAPAGLPPTGTVPYCWCKLVATSDRCPSRDGGRHGRRTVALSQFGVCTTSHTTANAKPFALRTHQHARPGYGIIIMPLKVCSWQNHRHRRKPLQLFYSGLMNDTTGFLSNGIYKYRRTIQYSCSIDLLLGVLSYSQYFTFEKIFRQ